MLDYEGKDNSFSINTAKSGLLGKKNKLAFVQQRQGLPDLQYN